MKKKVVLAVCFCFVVIVLCSSCGDNPFYSKAVVSSPNGSISDGAKAISPDGQYILSESSPYGQGKVVVQDKDGNDVQRWDILKGGANDIKALAWSADSKKFAVMYHGGDAPGIRVFEVKNDAEIGTVSISKWYHFMAFNKNSDKIIVSEQGQDQETLEIEPAIVVKSSTIPPVETGESSTDKQKTATSAPTPKDQSEQEGTVSPFFGREDAIFSHDGDVSQGQKATSPNGKYYACEVKPYGQGNIAVFSQKGKQIQKWESMSNNNPLKGLAWSPDSNKLAIMYHGGMRPAIQVVKIGKNNVIAASEISTWYHFMVFAKDGKTLLLAESENGSVTKLKPRAIQ